MDILQIIQKCANSGKHTICRATVVLIPVKLINHGEMNFQRDSYLCNLAAIVYLFKTKSKTNPKMRVAVFHRNHSCMPKEKVSISKFVY